ncbi:MAG: hypothetical protein WC663_01000 [Patescibacteria group bacterium]|jgi:hypothetical protein
MKTRSKLIIGSLIFLILIIVGALLVQYFFKNKNETQLQTSLESVTAFSANETNQIKTEISETIQFPSHILSNGEIYSYNLDNSKFYKTNLSTKKSLAIIPFANTDNIINAQWDQSNDKVLAIQDNSYKIFSLNDSKVYPLDNNLSNLFWLDGNRLIGNYYKPEDSTNRILIINSQGELQETILDLETSIDALPVNIIGASNNNVYYLLNGYLYELNLLTKENNKIIEQQITSAKISPRSDKIIYSTFIDEKFSDFVFDLNTRATAQLQNIDIDASNILWSSDESTLYLIKNSLEISEGSSASSYYLLDKIEKYNLNNQQVESTIDIAGQGKYGADDFFLSSDESKIYFVNSANSFLYSINLK